MQAVCKTSTVTAQNNSDNVGKNCWVIGCFSDIAFLHSACGLLVIPVGLIAYNAPQTWTCLFWVWSLLFSLPHQAATIVRMAIDRDCKRHNRHLYVFTPVVLAAVLSILILGLNLLAFVVLVWLVAQWWHVTAQNYGILRRYIRMSGSSPHEAVNKAATAANFLVSFACLAHVLSLSPAKLFWYQIYVPDPKVLGVLAITGGALSMAALLCYGVLELNALRSGKFVPGRFLTVLGGVSVQSIACLWIAELSWAYVAVSIWHNMQYLAYAERFRSNPPANTDCAPLSMWQHLLAVVFLTAVSRFLFYGAELWLASGLAVLQLTYAFHHYMADALIWRRRPSRNPAQHA